MHIRFIFPALYFSQNGNIFPQGNINASKDYRKFVPTTPMKSSARSEAGPITSELLDVFLYGKRKIQAIDLEEAKRQKTSKDSYEKKNEKDIKAFPKCKCIFLIFKQRFVSY